MTLPKYEHGVYLLPAPKPEIKDYVFINIIIHSLRNKKDTVV